MMKFVVFILVLILFPSVALAESEKELIQSHLQMVEEGLRAKDVSHLPKSQQQARKQNLDNLRTYWQKGVFPQNTRHPNARVPYFIDDNGRACAMGHLLIESGHKEAALQIQLRENNAYVHDIESPELQTWLKNSGLTLNEAAWIQPQYKPQGPRCDCDCDLALVNDGTNIFVNECVAVRCNQADTKALEVGCGTLKSLVASYRVYPSAYEIEGPFHINDVCREERVASKEDYQKWSTPVMCQNPATKITGEYEPEDEGCSVANRSGKPTIPAILWLIVLGFGLLTKRYRYATG